MSEPQREKSRDSAILVLGVANSGKSTFINWVLKSLTEGAEVAAVAVRNGMSAQTSQVQEACLDAPSVCAGRRVTLVDTPGFDHTDMSDSQVLEATASWLQTSFQGGTRIGAVIYVHNITCDYLTPIMRLDFEVLEKCCGDAVIDHGMVTIVTTKWGRASPDEAHAREEEMKKGLWSDFARRGCRVRSIASAEDAGAVVKDILDGYPKPGEEIPPLQIQHQLLELGLPLSETAVGHILQLLSAESAQSKKGKAKAGRTSSGIRKLLSTFLSGDDSPERHRRTVLKKNGPKGAAGMSRSRSMGPPSGVRANTRVKSEAFEFFIPNQVPYPTTSQGEGNGDPTARQDDGLDLMRRVYQADPLLSQPARLPADQRNDEQVLIGPTHGVVDGGSGNDENETGGEEISRGMDHVGVGEVRRGDSPSNSAEALVRGSDPVSASRESEPQTKSRLVEPVLEGQQQIGLDMTSKFEPNDLPTERGQGIDFIPKPHAEADRESCSDTLESEFVSCKTSIEDPHREEVEPVIRPEETKGSAASGVADDTCASPSKGESSEPSPESVSQCGGRSVKEERVGTPATRPPPNPGAFDGEAELCVSPAENENYHDVGRMLVQGSQDEGSAGRGWSRLNPFRYW